ncbi:MAG: DoxX family protein [Pseudomonadota bacterium]
MATAKNMTRAYWTATTIFALLLLMDGGGGVAGASQGQDVLIHLGYPLYLMPFLGVLKILAAVAILQTRFTVVKEWAYAGFAFNCLGAFVSRLVVGDSGIDLWFPWIFFLFGAVPYVLWKKTTAAPTAGSLPV